MIIEKKINEERPFQKMVEMPGDLTRRMDLMDR